MTKKKSVFIGRIAAILCAALFTGIVCTGCGSQAEGSADTGSESQVNGDTDAGSESQADGDAKLQTEDRTEIQVFIAASLQTVMEQLGQKYHEEHPNVNITYHADSSGTLLTQIAEVYECDIFFSAAQKQMDQLEADGLVVEGTRADVVNNQVVVVKRKDSDTKVTGLSDLKNAQSIALAGGSVPVGRYTRQALVNLGILEQAEDPAAITTQQVSEALDGAEISEQDNVSKVLLAVVEGSCEVGTVYYSDTYGYEDELEILEKVSYDLTGNVIYPVAQVVNSEADEVQTKAAADFTAYILSEQAKAVFEEYYYDPVG